MSTYPTPENRPVHRRRRKRSKLQVFKEAYLPPILAAGIIILIIVFISSSVASANKKKQEEQDANIAASIAQQEAHEALLQQAEMLMREATQLAAEYDYDGALAVLDRFTGDRQAFPSLNSLWETYTEAKRNLVAWNDPSVIPNLSFQLLIADPQRAFNDPTYQASFDRNFVTTGEFSKILESLYSNGYILIRPEDIFESTDTGFTPKTLYLPAGKKPLLLTQTNVNYSLYLVDSDGDLVADENGRGFASKLILDDSGKITCQMADANGNIVTGAYDLVPILEAFVEAHPDFSYRGAKATLALTGYNGLFGYRTHTAAKDKLSADAYAQEVAGAKAIAAALTERGYTLACYTYANTNYANALSTRIEMDLNSWRAEVTPILGQLDIMVFAQNGDIDTATGSYTGEKFQLLQQAGFRYYLGFCTTGQKWATIKTDYVRMGRLMVSGQNIREHADWFDGIFSCTDLLER